MAQFLRPDGEITSTAITGSYLDIDEVTVSNTDFIVSTGTGTSQYEASTSNVAAPGVGTHTVRYTCAQVDGTTPDSGGTAATLDVTLYQGATLISSDTQRTQDGAWTTYSWNLTAGEVSNITDYDDLRIRFDMVNSGGSPANRRQYAVSHAEIEVPDAADELGTPPDIESASVVETPTITQNHQFLADEISSLTEVDSGTSPLGQNHSLLADEISSLTEVDTPLLTRVVVFLADEIQSLTEVDSGTSPIGQIHNFLADEINSLSEVDTTDITQNHSLLADEISSLTEVDTPLFTGISVLPAATEIESATEVDSGTSSIGQIHNFLADEISSLTEVDTPLFTGISVLPAATEIESATEVDTPLFTGISVLPAATEIESATEVDNPTVQDITTFAATEIESATQIRSPVFLETRVKGLTSYFANVAYSIGTTSSVTAWHTLHSVNTNCLVVCMSFMSSDVTASPSKTYTITFGGQSLTAAVSYDPPDNDFASLIYYLLDPPTTNSQLSISTNDAFRNITVSLVELKGINTANPIGNTETATAETVAITPTSVSSTIISTKATKEIGAGNVTPSTDNIELIDFQGGGL